MKDVMVRASADASSLIGIKKTTIKIFFFRVAPVQVRKIVPKGVPRAYAPYFACENLYLLAFSSSLVIIYFDMVVELHFFKLLIILL